ncbi:hypothetical protein DOY81_013093 [Sarcophaga bullata]|nr:hypothetical protein DOY81_013093 [Sarcophaga bullata]
MPSPKMKALEGKVKLHNNTIGTTTANLERPSCSTKVKKEFENDKESTKDTAVQNVMDKPGRKMLALVGKVDFVLKITKMYPNIDALWNVYGKLIKLSNGKNRYEHILLMRNSEGDGPILQCIYYDFDNTLAEYSNDKNIRVVGRMTGCNRLRIFKLQALDELPQHTSFMRIQNVNTFVLLQNQNANG